MAARAKPRSALVRVRRAFVRVGGAFLLALLAAFPASASLSAPAGESHGSIPGISVIPHGKREVKVSFTLRAWRGGSRVVLYAGPTVGAGLPLAEVVASAGLSSYEFLDRSGHDGRWVYWLVVVDDHARSSVLGSLVCVSPSMDEGFVPVAPHARAALVDRHGIEPPDRRWAPAGVPPAIGDLFLDAPPAPPPEGS